MKQYPFLFVGNIATTKNNTSLRHIASVLVSYDQNHNMLQHAKIIVRVLCHKLRSTHSLSASSAAWQWVIKSRFSATLKIHRKFWFRPKTNIFAPFCSELYKDLFKPKIIFGFIGTLRLEDIEDSCIVIK